MLSRVVQVSVVNNCMSRFGNILNLINMLQLFFSDVHYVVTEHGIAFLFGKTMHERVHSDENIIHEDNARIMES